MRKASIKETGEELSPAEWARFDAAVAGLKAERDRAGSRDDEPGLFETHPPHQAHRDRRAQGF